MTDTAFVKPDACYKNSYVAALREGFRSIQMPSERIDWIENNFEEYLREEEDLTSRPEWWQKDALPVELADGRIVRRVACTTLWLVSDDHFIGEIAVRHSLTPELSLVGGHIGYNVRLNARKKGYGGLLLAQGLKEAAQLGINPALITCNDDNAGSIKIIEQAGGILKDKIAITGRAVLHRRYTIQTTAV